MKVEQQKNRSVVLCYVLAMEIEVEADKLTGTRSGGPRGVGGVGGRAAEGIGAGTRDGAPRPEHMRAGAKAGTWAGTGASASVEPPRIRGSGMMDLGEGVPVTSVRAVQQIVHSMISS